MMESLTAVLSAMILAKSPSSLSMLVNTLCTIGKMQDKDSLFCTKKTVATSTGSSNLANSSSKTHW